MKMSQTDTAPEAGFTLIESLVVLAIVGVVLAGAVPLYSTLAPKLQIASATQELLADLHLARSEAVIQKKTSSVTFHSNPSEYVIAGRRHALPVTVAVSGTDNALGEEATLHFYPDGSADDAQIVLSNKQRKSTIHLNWLTGRAWLDDG